MKNFIYLLAPLCLVCGCSGDRLQLADGSAGISGDAAQHEMIVLGSQLEDPYSVDNITKALSSVYPTKAGRVVVEPTDLYVRFLPEDEDEMKQLEAMGLQLLDHPVDFEIVREGDWYHDPELDPESITWQYAVVGKDFNFPSWIRYEVLDKCYIPEHDYSTKADGIDWEQVEMESYRLTGNQDLLATQTKSGASSAKPSGRITIRDPEYSDEAFGVKGVKVSCNTFVKFASAYTDEDGNYEMKVNFSSKPRYRLVFRNSKGFAIGFNLIVSPASSSTLGTAEPSGVDLEITSSSERKLFMRSVVNNAGYEYFSSCASKDNNMKLPPANLRIWLFPNLNIGSAPMMQQGVIIDESLIAKYLGSFSWIVKMFLPDITLGLKGLYSYSELYSAAVHEFAHASHFMQAGKDFWNAYVEFILRSFVTSGFVTYGTGTEDDHGYCEVGEMWAYYLQTVMYRDRYEGSEAAFGANYWFSPQILLNLDERGLSRAKLLKAFSSDVCDRNALQSRLVSLYPEFKSTINQAFGRYE